MEDNVSSSQAVSKVQALASLGPLFEDSSAEREREKLPQYFVETTYWTKLKEGGVDVILGPKGSGKTALYAVLLKNDAELLSSAKTVVVKAQEPLGASIFGEALKARSEAL